MLQITDLDVSYRRRRTTKRVLSKIDLRIDAGEAVAVIGESGSGKTTIARAILGSAKPSTGSIVFDGRDLTTLSGRERRLFRRSGAIDYVFQDSLRSLDPGLSVGESAIEPLLVRTDVNRQDAIVKARALFARLGLDDHLFDRLPRDLSGGQRQRVGLVRALVLEPRLLILDEPLSALDAATKATVIELLHELRERGVSLFLITHDIGSVTAITDRTVVLWNGSIVEERPTADIVRSPEHDYTRLLVGSAASLSDHGVPRAERIALRERLGIGTGAGAQVTDPALTQR